MCKSEFLYGRKILSKINSFITDTCVKEYMFLNRQIHTHTHTQSAWYISKVKKTLLSYLIGISELYAYQSIIKRKKMKIIESKNVFLF